jgi:hypothetical protein
MMMNQRKERLTLRGMIREAASAPIASLAGGRTANHPVGGVGHAGPQPNGERRELEVIALSSGTSKNGYTYRPAVVAALVPLLEGAQAFADHPAPQDRPERSVRDLVGFYRHARLEQDKLPGQPPGQARAVATLHLLEPAGWLWEMICEALEQGVPGLVGISIDVDGMVEARQDASGQFITEVTRIVRLNSCDIVTKPSAGGAILGLARQRFPAQAARSNGGNLQMAKRMDLAEAAKHAAREAAKQPSSKQPYYKERAAGSLRRIREDGAWSDDSAPLLADVADDAAGTADADAQDDNVTQMAALHEDARRALVAARRAQRLAECELLLGRRLRESNLPGPVVSKLRRRFEGQAFEANELERAITDERETLAALAGLGLIREMGYEKPQVTNMITEAEKIQAAFDRMFDLEVDARFAGVRAFGSIREAYARVSGDPSVRGISGYSTLGQIRVDERAPITRISEADMTTANFSYLLGVSMNKRLLHDYQAWPAEWRRFCTEVPIRDFKQQTRVRLGAFGSLSTVAEDAAYTTVTLSDTAATYSATKRGNIVTISRETIVNDDLHAIKQIPTKLAVAAAYTLAEFVYGFMSSNGNIYDGNALFDATNHKNLGSSALSSSAMQAGVTAMREQTNYASKRIGLRPKYLIVPPELEFTGLVLVKSAGVPGSNNNDINPMMGYTQLIVSPQLPAAGTPSNSSWYLAADPAEVDTIEIGFVGGQVNPALFIQDNPLFGLNFTQDAVSYKCRHEYGGAVMDWRGLYRGI